VRRAERRRVLAAVKLVVAPHPAEVRLLGPRAQMLDPHGRTRAIAEPGCARCITVRSGSRVRATGDLAHERRAASRDRGERRRASPGTRGESGGVAEVCVSDHESEVLDAGLRVATLGAASDFCNARRRIETRQAQAKAALSGGADTASPIHVHRCQHTAVHRSVLPKFRGVRARDAKREAEAAQSERTRSCRNGVASR
jgi:hypothetical protein